MNLELIRKSVSQKIPSNAALFYKAKAKQLENITDFERLAVSAI